MTRILKISLVILSLILLSACGRDQSELQSSTEKITFAAYSGDVGFLGYVAEQQGYFKNNGLDITINYYEAGKLATDALIEGQADISVGSDFVFVSNSFDNPDLRIFGTIDIARDCSLISRKDHGIKEPRDLKGKKIGVTRKSSGEFYLGRFLMFQGIPLADVEIFDLKPSEIVRAITSGDIDAALTWEPNIYKMKKNLGEKVNIWPGQSQQDFYFLLLTKEAWLKQHPASIKALLKSFLQAEQFVKKNEREAKRLLKVRDKYDIDYLDYVWPGLNFTVKLPQPLLLAMEDQAEWRIENKLTNKSQVPNYLNYIYFDGLVNLKPEAVTIIR